MTSREVVSAFVERLQEVNDIINCVVDSRFREALEEARNVDALISGSSSTEVEALGTGT